MSRLSRILVLAVLGIALIPATAHAQFFGGFGWPYGGYGGFGGWPFGGYGGYGSFGGYPLGGFMSPFGYGGGGWGMVTGPSFYSTSFMVPVMYTVSTPSSGYQRDVPVEPQMRPAVWPAIPYRDSPRTDARARLDVRVPSASAEVSLNGVAMQQTGIDRHYMTPPLAPGAYTFDVRVSWRDSAGKQVSEARKVEVRPGESQVVNFITAQ